MFPVRSVLLRLPQQALTQNAQRTVVSGPPAVRMPLVEKLAHMTVMALGFVSFPLYVLSNVRNYRERA